MLRLRCSDSTIERAFAIALDDLALNIVPLKDGVLEYEELVIRAGGGYEKPWTRDAAINVWNGAGLLYPEEARSTLLATLERGDGGLRIGAEYGQYWDAIISALGVWSYYLYTGDRQLLILGFEAICNSLAFLERTEFDGERDLFRGPAVYGDGVSAYPDIYARTVGGHSSILRWVGANREHTSKPGYGLPMLALSTNCLYFRVYQILPTMAEEVAAESDRNWKIMASRLREAINRHFWMPVGGHYRYLVDPFGGSDVQESLGHSFAILFGVADGEQRESLFQTQHVTAEGIPCLWPCFDRYRRDEEYGRHSGTVWPPIQGFWAEAAARHGHADLVAGELHTLAKRAVRDGQFFELYHPETAKPYGGLQEWEGRGIVNTWESYPHQTWSATAFLRIILLGITGMRFGTNGVRFEPCLPSPLETVELEGLRYRRATIDVVVRGPGIRIESVRVNGENVPPFVPAEANGRHVVEIALHGN